MLKFSFTIIFFCGLAAAQQKANPFNRISAATLFTGPKSPIVDTGYGKFQGKIDQTTGTASYLGIKYARAPRLNHSFLADQPINGVQDVSDYGPACPQHEFTSLLAPSDLGLGSLLGVIEAGLLSPVLKQSEDCLSINAQRPLNTGDKKLPVLLWIHGGAFESGESSSFLSETSAVQGVFYQGANIVKRSVKMGKPIVFVSINYRLNDLGFSASKKMKEAGLLNLGFEDQRNGLKWIQKYISHSSLGGSPKVTIMGESAGSWRRVSGHLVANNGDNEGLFRGAVGISGRSSQDYFIGYCSLASAWTLRPDGKFFEKSPDQLAAEGKIAPVPILTGCMADEGTLFSLINSLNTTTDDEFEDYFKTYWWPSVSSDQMQRLMEFYPEDPTRGSPFNTNLLYAVPRQFKRLAALIGDYSFQAQRRQLLDNASQAKWNYLTEQRLPLPLLEDTPIGKLVDSSQLTQIPLIGSFHASDIVLNWFGTLPDSLSQNSYHLMGILVSLVHDQDPNNHGMNDMPHWPQYNYESRETIHFVEGNVDVIKDDYREEQMDYINQIGDFLRI